MAGPGHDAMIVESAIQRLYLQDAWTIFWPRQLVSEQLGERAVLDALGQLVGNGKLRDEVLVHCSDGRVAFRGAPTAGKEWLARGECPYCTPEEMEHGIELRFTLSPEWRAQLETLRPAVTPEKKTPDSPRVT